MTSDIIKLLTDGGSAVAVIVVVFLFIKFLSEERKFSREERQSMRNRLSEVENLSHTERETTMTILTGHLQHVSSSLEKSATIYSQTMDSVGQELKLLRQQCERRAKSKEA